MENFDWRNSIRLNLLALKVFGLWPEGNKLYKFDLYFFYVVSAAIFLVGSFNLSQIINIFYIYSDLEILTASIQLMTTNILALVKVYIFLKNLRTIKQLMTVLQSYQFRPQNPEEIDQISPFTNQWKKVYLWYNFVVAFNLFMWSIAPLLSGEEEHQLPFAGWFPLDEKVSPNYQLVYIYQLVCIWFMSMANTNLDCICMALMMLIKTQLDLLCYRLKNLHKKRSFDDHFLACVKHHKAILSFAEKSNNFCNWIILGQFATSTAVTALIMFQLTLVSPLSGEGLSHLAYLHGITTQIFLYCWFGNEVKIQSNQLSFALYECDWSGQSQSVKKSLLIFWIRCQRPIVITAIKMFSLSLDTFISIMRSAYSYFALLSNVNAQ